MSELLTVAQVAQILGVSAESVTRKFAREKGVIDIGSPGTMKRRRYRVLRIPRSVVEKYVLLRGGRITVPDTPEKPKRQTMSKTEDEMTHDLATLANQHGSAARKTLNRIAERARAMTFVPQEQWQDMVWLDEDD